MRPAPDRLNATVLSGLGLLLFGTGGYGLARGYEAFGERQASDPVLGDTVREFVGRNDDWFWPGAAAVSLLVAYLGFRWLLAQVHAPTVSSLRVASDREGGSTEVAAPGAAAALAGDIEEYPGVRSARARVVDDGPEPRVDVTVDLHDDTEVPAVRSRIEEHALPRFAAALEVERLRARIHLRLAEPAGRTVR